MVGIFVDDRLEKVSAVLAHVLQLARTEEFAKFLELALGFLDYLAASFWVFLLCLNVLEGFHLGAFHCESGDIDLSAYEVADVAAAVA